MLPNLNIPSLRLFGPIEIHAFGVLVAVAVLLGFSLGKRRAANVGLDPNICASGMTWGVFAGFVFAHWVSAVFYFPERIADDPLYLLKFWDGISSFGGFIGGILGTYWYFRRMNVSFLDYTEAILFGLVPGWAVGRLGCTIAFDHPGLPTDFILGMMDEQGVVRHNLGLYEMVAALVLTGVLYLLKNVRPFRGFHCALVMVLYAPVRFLCDSLRIADKLYLGFTPGQYFSIIMALAAMGWIVVGLFHSRKHRSVPGL
jgi:phosphatidylglycerol:prolipoprotein diacylglycerol transferase